MTLDSLAADLYGWGLTAGQTVDCLWVFCVQMILARWNLAKEFTTQPGTWLDGLSTESDEFDGIPADMKKTQVWVEVGPINTSKVLFCFLFGTQ
jgi:hypothetical protein